MKLKFTLFALLATGFFGYSQTSFKLPEKYNFLTGYNGKKLVVQSDFDKDGYKDFVCILKKQNMFSREIIIAFFLSKKSKSKMYSYVPLDYEPVAIDFTNNVISIDYGDEYGVFGETLKFKYYSKINDFKLIGFDKNVYASEYGNGYLKSINLLTNVLELDKNDEKKYYKTKFSEITSTNMDLNTIKELRKI